MHMNGTTKKWIYALLIMVAMQPLLLPAQEKGMHKIEQIQSLKIGFISSRLQLTTDEAQRFWPIYNKYESEMQKIRKNIRGIMFEEVEKAGTFTEAEAEKILNDFVKFRLEEAEVIKKYANEFKKAIPANKVILLYKAEQDFKGELLRRLRDRRYLDRP